MTNQGIDRTAKTIRPKDGRTLGYAEYGDPNGGGEHPHALGRKGAALLHPHYG